MKKRSLKLIKKIKNIIVKILHKKHKKEDYQSICLDQNSTTNSWYDTKTITVSNEVIKLRERFLNELKKHSETPQNFSVAVQENEDYIYFLDFLLEESEGEEIPTNYQIKEGCQLSERKITEYKRKAYDEGVLVKGKNKYTLNFEWVKNRKEEFKND